MLWKHLIARLAAAERETGRDTTPLSRNVASLGRICGLTTEERAILALAVTMEKDDAVRECFLAHSWGRTPDLFRLIGVALDLPKPAVAHALRPKGTLRDSRLLILRPGSRHEAPLVLLDGLGAALDREQAGVDSLVAFFARRCGRSECDLAAFSHMGEQVDVALGVLRGALRSRARGVNLLFFGDPGTGKTQLARALAAELGARAYEVNDEDRDGDGCQGHHRLASCALAQRMLARTRRSVLVFDEAEDVFPHEVFAMFGMRQRSTEMKSWTHRLLEQNPVPTIWVMNRASHIDPATLRRFLVVVELRSPPTAVRARMIQKRLERSPVSAAWIERAASDERFTPADVERVARVARLLGRRKPEQLARALTHVVDASLALVRPARGLGPPAGPTPYALRFVNASVDLEKLSTSIKASARGSICLYGPPGTGKTTYVQHVARRLERPLHSVRGSDLLGMYVGETEKNLARAFREATAQGAILLLDEVDSLLRERELASRSWEVTQVNELLVQMESFAGLLFCATNLIDALDAASLRRFGLKIRFEALRAEQSLDLFSTVAGPASDDTRERLDRMNELTAGDFAAALRRLALLGEELTEAGLLRALTDEWAMKRHATRPIAGFRVSATRDA